MARRVLRALALVALALACLGGSGTLAAASGPITQVGTIDNADFKIEVPANWNGDLVLYSHGYVVPGSPNPPTDVGDPLTGQYLLSHGYALAGSAYRTTGWAVHEALIDQLNLLDRFDATFGTPVHTIAWGHSLGGMITAGLVQRAPQRFAGALPMCGVLAGGIGVWNVALDSEFVFKTLLAPNTNLQLVHITDPTANLTEAETILAAAQATPQGQARIALAAAVGDLPGWFSPVLPEPAPTDFADREVNQFLWDSQVDFPFVFALRAELEARAGGNPSWNVGVDYRKLLDQSINRDEVQALYAAAGLDLNQDLAALGSTQRITRDDPAARYLATNIIFDGDLGGMPVLTLHTTGDGLVLNQDEQAYAAIADQPDLLRERFVHRAGHCTFTPAETIAAFNSLVQRIDSGQWPGMRPQELNNSAAALGPEFNVLLSSMGVTPMPPAYLAFHPTHFPRPFAKDDGS